MAMAVFRRYGIRLKHLMSVVLVSLLLSVLWYNSSATLLCIESYYSYQPSNSERSLANLSSQNVPVTAPYGDAGLMATSENSSRKFYSTPTIKTEFPSEGLYSASSSVKDQTYGYVLIDNFPSHSQQAVGLRTLLSLQCMVGSFDLQMYILEPFIENSIVHTHVPSQRNTTLLSLSDFYDLEHFNTESKKQGMAEAVTWEHFLDNAPRKTIVVTSASSPGDCKCLFSRTGDSKKKSPKVIWSSTRTRECYPHEKMKSMLTTKILAERFGFCAVRVVDIYPSPHVCSEEELYNIVFGPWKPEEVTIVFGRWCAGMYIPNPLLPEPSMCQSACSWGLENKYLPSPQLLKHTKAFESQDSSDRGKIGVKLAVMLRTEHVLLSLKPTQGVLGARLCLARTRNLVHHLQSSLHVSQPFVTADIGKYGSGAWEDVPHEMNTTNDIESTLLGFFNYSLTFKQWEDSFAEVTGGIMDRGYIAVLQQAIASRADCLVFLGGGNFLRLALHEYINLHPDPSTWCIYFVCVEERFMNEYDNSLKQRSGRTISPSWQLLPENEQLKLYIGNVTTLR